MYYLITPNYDECLMYVHKNAFVEDINKRRDLTYIKDNALKYANKEDAYKALDCFNETRNIICSLFVIFIDDNN